MAIDDVVQDLQHQLPQLAVLHQRDGEERIQEGWRQRRHHGLGLKARGHLRGSEEDTLIRVCVCGGGEGGVGGADHNEGAQQHGLDPLGPLMSVTSNTAEL